MSCTPGLEEVITLLWGSKYNIRSSHIYLSISVDDLGRYPVLVPFSPTSGSTSLFEKGILETLQRLAVHLVDTS